MEDDEKLVPWVRDIVHMSDTEFEKYSMEVLKCFAETEDLPNFQILHNQKLQAHDGTYQIDVYAEFTVMGIKMKMLVECKHYNNPIERKIISELHDKLESTGCNKGVVITNSYYQSGAIEYAKAHGITLIKVFDSFWRFVSNAAPGYEDAHTIYMHNFSSLYPRYYANVMTGEGIWGDQVFPTEAMEKEIHDRAIQLMPEQYRR